MQFVKMHGAGNDYVLVAASDLPRGVDRSRLARDISDRRRGVGSDGLIIVEPSDRAAGRMEMYNADGTRSRMCGNGVRLVAKYLVERQARPVDACDVDTDSGIRAVTLFRREGRIVGGRASMGAPVFERARIPVRESTRPDPDGIARESFDLDGARHQGACLSMGNPHVVFLVDDVAGVPVARWGPQVESDARFPERVNVEFAEMRGATEIVERTWERGAGETDSCGSGACAAAVALMRAGRAERRVRVRQRGGVLEVEWHTDGQVYLSGPAETAFHGEWNEAEHDAV